MESRNPGIGRAIGWGRTPAGLEFQCVAAGLMAASVTVDVRLLRLLHQEGFHNCLWMNPYVATQTAMYQEGAAKGYFVRRPDGSVYGPSW